MRCLSFFVWEGWRKANYSFPLNTLLVQDPLQAKTLLDICRIVWYIVCRTNKELAHDYRKTGTNGKERRGLFEDRGGMEDKVLSPPQ